MDAIAMPMMNIMVRLPELSDLNDLQDVTASPPIIRRPAFASLADADW